MRTYLEGYHFTILMEHEAGYSLHRIKKSEVERKPEDLPDFCIRNNQLYRHLRESQDLTEPEIVNPLETLRLKDNPEKIVGSILQLYDIWL